MHITLNEDRFKDLVNIADVTFEARNRTYSIGEQIEFFFRMPRTTTITVEEVSYADNYDSIALEDDEWVCIVATSLVVDYDRAYDREFFQVHNVAWSYFGAAEADNGLIYTEVLQINSHEIVFKLPAGERAKYLYIRSPSYWGILRTVDIG